MNFRVEFLRSSVLNPVPATSPLASRGQPEAKGVFLGAHKLQLLSRNQFGRLKWHATVFQAFFNVFFFNPLDDY